MHAQTESPTLPAFRAPASALPTHLNGWWLPILSAILFFSFLGSRGLNEPDEGRYAEIGREMAVTGEWLIPHLNGFEHFQKPPLLYWLTATSIRLFGANEWAARLPSALAALASVLLTAWIAGRLFGQARSFWAGLILLSCTGFFLLARLLTPDMLLTGCILGSITCFLRFAGDGGRLRWGYLFFASLGIGFLAKGPMALVVPLSAALAWDWRARQLQPTAPRLPWIAGSLLTLTISLSWFVTLSAWRHDLFTYFWKYELMQRFASSAHGRAKPFWFFAPVLLIALLPWSFLLPHLAKKAWAQWRAKSLTPAQSALAGWVLPPLLILSCSGSKLPTYILPLLPALAIGCACLLTPKRAASPRWLPRLAGAAICLSLMAAAAFPFFNDRLGPQASLRDLLRTIASRPEFRQARVVAVEVRAHSLEFYLQRLVSTTREQADIVLPTSPAQDQRLLSTFDFHSEDLVPETDQPPVLVLTRRNRVQVSFPLASWVELGRAGDFVLLRSSGQKSAPTASSQ